MRKFTVVLSLTLLCVVAAPFASAQVRAWGVRVAPSYGSHLVVKKVPPEYPEGAKKQHNEGTVVVKVRIDVKGKLMQPL